jgi:hypothetical protein
MASLMDAPPAAKNPIGSSDYLVDKRKTNDEAQRDALLALSAMHGLGNSAK